MGTEIESPQGMVILSHPTGNANVRNAALALSEAGLLSRFVTSIAVSTKWGALPVQPFGLRQLWRRRSYSTPVLRRTVGHPMRELGRHVLSALGWQSLVGRPGAPFSVDAVYRSIDRQTARLLTRAPAAKAVYCYEDSAVQTFRQARARGVRTIYELPTPYWRLKETISREEARLQPDWAGTLRFDQETPEKIGRKDEELRLADTVIVPSDFVADSLKLAPEMPRRVRVVPYGGPSEADDEAVLEAASVERDRQELRVIYVGNLGQAKGMSYLVDAFEGLQGKACLTMIGTLPSSVPPQLAAFLPRHRYLGSLPHGEVLKEMRQHEVLVLPTLFEGLALVLLEAMSQGLTVITTPHSGVSGIIRDGREGFLVPIRSVDALSAKLRWLGENREALARMRLSARTTARTMTWEGYRARLAATVAESIRATTSAR